MVIGPGVGQYVECCLNSDMYMKMRLAKRTKMLGNLVMIDHSLNLGTASLTRK